jgi:exosortase A
LRFFYESNHDTGSKKDDFVMTEAAARFTRRWRATLIASVLLFVALLLLFRSTATGMVLTWYHFETYTHGFLILPISLWLIWHKRDYLSGLTAQPSLMLLIPLFAGLFVWALARLTGVQVVEQFAFVGVLISALAAVIGWQAARSLAFPLLFLFFAVPMGEDLVPPMMEFTATFTVEALKLSGIPVYRDGLWFALPSGNWSVVEACSGVRYLIASVTLGVMYAYITYHTLWKRLLFIAMSAAVPILANGLRAYMIVMIGHLSNMEYATGVDHLIYGWVFFGIVMLILFWIGSFWQEEPEPPAIVPPNRPMSEKSAMLRLVLVVGLVLGAASTTVWYTEKAEASGAQTSTKLAAPAGSGDWSLSADPVSWPAGLLPSPHKIEARYTKGDAEVQLYAVLFPRQRQGSEAITGRNRIADDPQRRNQLGKVIVSLGDEEVAVNRVRVVVDSDGALHEHLVWQWYRVAGRSLTNRYQGKAWEALARLWPGRADGAWIALTTPWDGQDIDAVEQQLAEFAQIMVPKVNDEIDAVLGLED